MFVAVALFTIFLLVVLFVIYSQNQTTQAPENQSVQREVYVSMTTSPKRIESIEKTINCMLGQTLKPTRIILNLPTIFKRDNSTFGNLPQFITNNPLIKVNFTEDIGPATKILPSVRLATNPEAFILSVDDDIYYPPDLLRQYVETAESFDRDVVVSNSFRMPGARNICNKAKECAPLRNLLEGYAGVLYRQRYLADMDYSILFDREKADACYRGDDYFLSNHIHKKKIPIIALPERRFEEMKKSFDYKNQEIDTALTAGAGIGTYKLGHNADALHLQPGGHPYAQCEEFLKKRGELHMPSDLQIWLLSNFSFMSDISSRIRINVIDKFT
jgi:hypothetical protein